MIGRVAVMAALLAALVGWAAPAPVSADGFTIVLNTTVEGATTLSGAVRNVPPGTQTVKLVLRLKSGDVQSQMIDQFTHGNFLFKNVKAGSWVSLKATALGGVAEQSVLVSPEAASPSNGYGDGNYQGCQCPLYFPGYLGVNGSGYAYPGNYGAPGYGPYASPATYFYPGSYTNPGAYSYPGLYYYPGYGYPGGTAYPSYNYPGSTFPPPSNGYYGYPGYGFPYPDPYSWW